MACEQEQQALDVAAADLQNAITAEVAAVATKMTTAAADAQADIDVSDAATLRQSKQADYDTAYTALMNCLSQ